MSRIRVLALLLLGIATSVGAAPAIAPAPPAASSAERDEFILGNVVFVLLHEFGHAVIRDFQVPILGLEENSADTLAAVTLIRAELTDRRADDAFDFARLLGMAAVSNILTWRAGLERENPELIYWAQHDLSARRGARILCLLIGSDPQRFGWLVESGEVPEVRGEACPDEYAVAEHAVLWVARTYGRFANGRGVDEGKEIDIRYFDTRNAVQARIVSRLRAGQVLEKVAAFYDRMFRFAEPLTVRLVSCGTPNAYWDPDARQLRFCYELLDTFDKMSINPAVGKAYQLFRNRATIPTGNEGPSPQGESQ